MSGPTARGGRSAAPLVAVLAVTAVVLLVGVLGATAGPERLLDGPGPLPGGVDGSQTTDITGDPTPLEETEEQRRDSPPEQPSGHWVGVLLRVLLVGIVLALLARVVHRWWQRRGPRRRRRERPDEVDLAPIDPVAAATEAMVEDAVSQRALLAQGSPRNAIVACWHRFEVQARRAGVPRADWETSSEFGLRLLDLVGAEWSAVTTLGELYRTARFSDHDVTERDREAALDAVVRIQDGLAARTPRGAPRRAGS